MKNTWHAYEDIVAFTNDALVGSLDINFRDEPFFVSTANNPQSSFDVIRGGGMGGSGARPLGVWRRGGVEGSGGGCVGVGRGEEGPEERVPKN